MTDEQLIEKAAKAINPGAWRGRVALDPRWAAETEHLRITARRQAADALAVFEEAHAPTNDEREARLDSERLRQIAEWQGMDCGNEEVAHRLNRIADRLDRLAAGFRRSVVPETGGEDDECGFTPSEGAVRDVYVGALVEDGSATEREADAEFSRFVAALRRSAERACFGHCDKEGWYSECVSKPEPEPQGEPSDDRPHSRACGIKPHAHGMDCHASCPTCRREPQAEPSFTEHLTGGHDGTCPGIGAQAEPSDAQMLYMICLALEEGLDGVRSIDLPDLIVKMIAEHWGTADEDTSPGEAEAALAQLAPYIPDHMRTPEPQGEPWVQSSTAFETTREAYEHMQGEQAVAEALCASENAGSASWGMATDEQRDWYTSQARVALRAASAVTGQGECS